MNMNFIRKLPIPKDIKAEYPVTPELAAKKAERELDSDEAEAAKKKWSGVSFVGFMVAFFALEFIPTIIMMFI